MSVPTIGRYEIKTELGEGGMASVYLARDPYVQRQVAIKVLSYQLTTDELFQEYFQREAEVIAALEHPCIVPIFDFGRLGTQPYIVMRYMAGGTLQDLLDKGKLELSRLAQIIDRVAKGLDAAHARGIIHRDVKPSNILFDMEGEAYLGDFGLAKSLSLSTDDEGTMFVGTPEYMSPEQVHDVKLNGQSDVYGLGAVLYYALVGQVPYDKDSSMATAKAHITDPVPRVLDVRPDLQSVWDEVVGKAMAKNPNDRYATASELALDVREVISGRWYLRKLVG
ncbi:MAG: serine/threonine protein kinase [Chloroflexi bacterium]|nr:serine/threonine protein kinase [Chloroflexota bacterium]